MSEISTSPSERSFEQALKELETIVQEMEDGGSDLDSALRRYEEGILLAQFCLNRLQSAELRVRELSLE